MFVCWVIKVDKEDKLLEKSLLSCRITDANTAENLFLLTVWRLLMLQGGNDVGSAVIASELDALSVTFPEY